jgi:hypothetical protein
MKYDIDWSKSINGVMLCSFEKTIKLIPEVKPILDELINSNMLELKIEDYVVDVKIHMLMPNTFPCIPNWHRDFAPRDEEGRRVNKEPHKEKMYMWLSGYPLTEYSNNKGDIIFKPAQEWHSFTSNDLHRGTMSTQHTWRCFIRVIPKKFIHSSTKNIGTERIHTQVYLDSNRFTW